MTAVVVALGLVVALLGVLVVGLLRSNADVLRSLHDLGIREAELGRGATEPRRPVQPRGSTEVVRHDIAGVSPAGDALQVGIEGAPGRTLVAFLTSGCSTCHGFWAALGPDALSDVRGVGATRIVAVTRDPDDESPPAVLELAHPDLITVMSSQAWDDYQVPVSPYFVLVDGTAGVIGEGATATWDQLIELLQRAVADGGISPVAPTQGLSRRALLSRGRVVERADRALLDAGIDPYAPDEPVQP